MRYRLDIIECTSFLEIERRLFPLLETYRTSFPEERSAPILIKPNLNSNMNALTGNTTDLRLLSAVIKFLKNEGYTNITIGEGTNSGFYRNRISVISRLAVDRLAAFHRVAVKDLNYAEPVFIDYENGVKAGVAKDCVEAAMIINLPKLKTHFEMGMSVCLKNLMGCLVGQENKKKTHRSLAANILNINKAVRPSLHLVDAVFAMEGLGPSRGVPLNTGMLIIGNDPYIIDLVCARLAGIEPNRVKTLAEADRRGLLDPERRAFADSIELKRTFRFKPAEPGPIAAFIHSPKRQSFFLAIRNLAPFRWLCSTRLVGHLLVLSGLRQDVFIAEDSSITTIKVDAEKCVRCGKCADHCPIALNPPEALETEQGRTACIKCLYCFCVCPEKAIELEGKAGFLKEHIKQYDSIIRDITRRGGST